MVINVSLKREYIPEWNGNRDLKEGQFTVLHRAPSMALYDELVPKPKVVLKVGKEGSEGGETELTIDTSAMVRRMVVEIKGLSFSTEEGSSIVPKDGSDLFKENLPSYVSGLTDELGRYFQTLLTEKVVDSKN